MRLRLTESQRAAVEVAVRTEKRTRPWKRYQAMLLLAAGQAPATVAEAVRSSTAHVSNWAARWRRAGVAGLAEGPHPGVARRLHAADEALLAALVVADPPERGRRVTGWTVPLLRTELAQAGCPGSARTIRRAVHRRGYRWKRPQYVLGRPDPAHAEK